MFESRALEPVPDMALNLQHDRSRVIASLGDGLDLRHTRESFGVRTELRANSAELSLVRRGALRGLSVEFRSLDEYRDRAGLRVIRRASCEAVGLVDVSSYPGRVELRQLDDAWLRASISYNTVMACDCVGPACNSVSFEPGSFVIPDEVLAINGPASRVLGSLRRGSLVIEDTDTSMELGIVSSAEGTVAREVIEAAAVAPVFARPLLDDVESEFVETAGVRRYSRAVVRAWLIKSTWTDEGHTPVVIEGRMHSSRTGKRIWL